ncbi:MAG: hypothetical protein JW809_05890 [Pirellulales bacterium]|nr:hypothetical protein [Pirellulales bacterium]
MGFRLGGGGDLRSGMARPWPLRKNLVWLLAVGRDRQPRLSATERQVARLIALDCTTHEIAALLGRTPAAVRRAAARLRKKLLATDRAQLAAIVRRDLLDPVDAQRSVVEQLYLRRRRPPARMPPAAS